MLVVVLIAIVVLFVICTTPAAILSIVYEEAKTQEVSFTVFRAIANNLELLGFACNFFVYCLCSADIRRAFTDVLFENRLAVFIRGWLSAKNSTHSGSDGDLAAATAACVARHSGNFSQQAPGCSGLQDLPESVALKMAMPRETEELAAPSGVVVNNIVMDVGGDHSPASIDRADML